MITKIYLKNVSIMSPGCKISKKPQKFKQNFINSKLSTSLNSLNSFHNKSNDIISIVHEIHKTFMWRITHQDVYVGIDSTYSIKKWCNVSTHSKSNEKQQKEKKKKFKWKNKSNLYASRVVAFTWILFAFEEDEAVPF